MPANPGNYPFHPSYRITHTEPVSNWAKTVFHTAQDHIHKQEWEEALNSFYRALDYQDEFIDAHLWVARLTDDRDEKRNHIEVVLAWQPNHIEALRELMILNGELTREQAQNFSIHNEPILKKMDVLEHHQQKIQTLECPVCAGDLTTDENGEVECKFCGYALDKSKQANNSRSLTRALINQRINPEKWQVGNRVVHCNHCGAERTIAGKKLSSRCLFCGSNQIIIQDVLQSFQQPDAFIPFKLTESEAQQSIHKELNSLKERFIGLFDNNKVKQMQMSGVYLPFWIFDAHTTIIRTAHEKDRQRQHKPPERSTFDGLFNNIPVCAVESPGWQLTSQISDYDISNQVTYEPELLAKYPAEIYTIDFDQASLDARSYISKAAKDKYNAFSTQQEIHIFSQIQDMSFHLMLMPVWIATILEEDSELRTALVNGQTGKTALGKAQPPQEIDT